MTTSVTIKHEGSNDGQPIIVQAVSPVDGHEISSELVLPGDSVDVYVYAHQAVLIQEVPTDG